VYGTSTNAGSNYAHNSTPLMRGGPPKIVVWSRPNHATQFVLFASDPTQVWTAPAPKGPFTRAHATQSFEGGGHCAATFSPDGKAGYAPSEESGGGGRAIPAVLSPRRLCEVVF
jgi:hypothetical protein